MRLRSLAVAIAAAVIAAPALTSVAVAAPADTATATTATTKAGAASGWLARQLTNGDHFEVDFGGTFYPDAGLTIDGIFAFAETKTANTAGGKAATWLAANLASYVGDGVTESYVGATAKSSLAAQVRGLNPASFGGVDLPARLRSLLTPSGRFSDRSQYGDYSNAFGQSLAIITLKRTPGGAPASAVTFLAASQCPDGGFPIAYGATPCASDTDATAMAAQALFATGRYAKAEQGLTWLAGKQQAGGGISAGNGATTVAPNTNTTGLAGQAFRVGYRYAAAAKARTFVLSQQVECAGAVGERGAIAYDQNGYDPQTVVRATAQAVLGLGGPGFATLSSVGSTAAAPQLTCP